MFEGPDAERRQDHERRALEALHGRFPVPRLLESGQGWLLTGYVPGSHGQDLIDEGDAARVLSECGRALRLLHSLDARVLDPAAPPDAIIRHGDFGPNNMIFAPGTEGLVAVLDWEFSGVGDAITDIAWCEWIVRMHHPAAVDDLPAFFDTYGITPTWDERRAEMLRRCYWLKEFTDRWQPAGPATHEWQRRINLVRGWAE